MLAARSSSKEREARREGLFFYVVVLLVLAGLSALALSTSPGLRTPQRQAAFSALMLLHAYLHWRSPVLALRPDVAIPYLLAQGVLAVALVGLSTTAALAFSLFPVLVGVTAGTVRDKRLGIVAAVSYLAIGLWTLSGLLRWTSPSFNALIMGAAGLFALFFALAYRRQADARNEVQQLLARLTEAHDRLAEYALRIEDLTLAAERQRIARELHDTLAQGLAGLILQIEAAAGHVADARNDRASAILQHALVRAREALAEARRAIEGLRDIAPASGGVESALRREAERLTRTSGIPCRLELAALSEMASGGCEPVRRIVAEALANVARHARAGSVALSARCQGDEVAMVIEDDGVGFDLGLEQRRPGHYGLLGMRERARLAGGVLEVETAPGHGTRLRLRLPRRKAGADD